MNLNIEQLATKLLTKKELSMEDQDFNLDDIDFDEVEKRNAERIEQMNEDVPEADNDCGDSCKI